MTPEQHNKYLGIAHLTYAGLMLLLMGGMMLWMAFVFSLEPGPPPPPGVFIFMGVFMFAMVSFYATPSVIAGYALLKRKSWAKIAAIVAGVMSSMSAPFGTAVCAYTFWFLFSEPGKTLYDKPQQSLPPMGATWNMNSTQAREQVYTPSSTPPDWR